jgi:UDPglucose 6-dehydrogenase
MKSIPHRSSPASLQPQKIAVIGTGRLGLVTAAGLASFGHTVVALDDDEDRIERLCRLDLPIREKDLDELIRSQVAAGRLAFASDPTEALPLAEIVFIAVDTPSRADGSMDLGAVDAAGWQLAAGVRPPAVVVLKSTVPVGTAGRLQAELNESVDIGEAAPQVISNPEFLREGTAVADFMKPDRIIVGDDLPPGAGRARLIAAFSPLFAVGTRLIEMDTRSAELSKCAANAMRAARISFINEIAALASVTGADIERVREGIGSDPRIGGDCLRPGLGYGGSGLGSDVGALRETARRHNLRSDMLLATERVNSRQGCWGFDALRRDLGSRDALRGLRVAVWGLSFKPGTDSLQDAPSLALVDRLWRAGAQLSLFDPAAMDNARQAIAASKRITFAPTALDALRGAEVLLHVTEWPEFLAFDPTSVASLDLRAVYDGRNALDPVRWTALGVRMVQVGRPARGVRVLSDRRSRPSVYSMGAAEAESRIA